jgi:hypothetical protein
MNQSIYTRAVAGRLRSRLAAETSSSLSMFVLAGAASGEISTARLLLAGVAAVALLAVRALKAVLDWFFETIGFLLGQILFRCPRVVRIISILCGVAGVVYFLRDQHLLFVAACLALTALDLFAAIGPSLHREPRLLLMPYKGFAIASATLWGWGIGWLSAIVAYLVLRRAFLFVLDGMTISAAEALQRDRDRHTSALFEELRLSGGQKHPRDRIILYLRPFNVTGRLKRDEGEFFQAACKFAGNSDPLMGGFRVQ